MTTAVELRAVGRGDYEADFVVQERPTTQPPAALNLTNEQHQQLLDHLTEIGLEIICEARGPVPLLTFGRRMMERLQTHKTHVLPLPQFADAAQAHHPQHETRPASSHVAQRICRRWLRLQRPGPRHLAGQKPVTLLRLSSFWSPRRAAKLCRHSGAHRCPHRRSSLRPARPSNPAGEGKTGGTLLADWAD